MGSEYLTLIAENPKHCFVGLVTINRHLMKRIETLGFLKSPFTNTLIQ